MRIDFEVETFAVQPIAFDSRQDPVSSTEVFGALGSSSPQAQAIAFPIQNATRGKAQNGLGIGGPTDPMYTLDQASQHGVSYAIQAGALRENPLSGPDGMGVQADIAYTLEARAEVQAVAFQERGRDGGRSLEIGGDIAYALTAPSGGGRAQERNVLVGMAVRRLMPVECERLQGFPPGYTAIPMPERRNALPGAAPRVMADGPRYKALGNSWAVNKFKWLGARIDARLRMTMEKAA